MKETPGGEIELIPIFKETTPDECVRGILGISLNEFVDKVKRNKDGEYDFLYEEPPAARKCV